MQVLIIEFEEVAEFFHSNSVFFNNNMGVRCHLSLIIPRRIIDVIHILHEIIILLRKLCLTDRRIWTTYVNQFFFILFQDLLCLREEVFQISFCLSDFKFYIVDSLLLLLELLLLWEAHSLCFQHFFVGLVLLYFDQGFFVNLRPGQMLRYVFRFIPSWSNGDCGTIEIQVSLWLPYLSWNFVRDGMYNSHVRMGILRNLPERFELMGFGDVIICFSWHSLLSLHNLIISIIRCFNFSTCQWKSNWFFGFASFGSCAHLFYYFFLNYNNL